MIELSNTTALTLEPGQTITFDKVLLKTGCGECHRANTGSVKLCGKGTYVVSFSANIGADTATTEAQLTIMLGGEALPGTTMISTTVAFGDLNAVSKTVPIKNCCCDYDRVTIQNTGASTVTIDAGCSLFVRRVS